MTSPEPPADLTSEGINGLDDFIRLLAGSWQALSAIGSAQVEFVRQRAMAADTPTLLTPEEVQEARRRGLVTPEQHRETLQRHGFSAGAQSVWEGMLPSLLDASALVALRRRELIESPAFIEGMARLGIEEAHAEALYRLTEYVPPAQDVVRFAVREVYTPDVAERYGAFEDFPEAAMPDFLKAGVSRDQALKYWAAHWELPSINLAFEALHRDAETGVTEEDVRLLLRAHDVLPFWRDRLIALASQPFTRVDIRRMHKLGILDRDQVVRAYRDIGYNAERAEAMTRFTEDLNAGEDEEAAKPWRASLRTRALGLYQDGILSQTELTDALSVVGHSQAEIDFYLAESDFIIEGERARDLRTGLRNLYVQGFWTAGRVVQRLAEAGYEQATIDALIGQWDLAKELREVTAEEREQRDLTRADILGAVGDDLLAVDEAMQALQDLGYDEREADLLVKREQLKAVQADRKRIEATVRGSYLAGKIDTASARQALGVAEVPAVRIESLLRLWEAEVEANAPTLTLAQVQAAMRKKIITRQEAATRIDRLGYSLADREILLDLAEGTDAL